MIEPTESEPKEELDLFIEAMKSMAEEVEEDPQFVLDAPHNTRISRLDETLLRGSRCCGGHRKRVACAKCVPSREREGAKSPPLLCTPINLPHGI